MSCPADEENKRGDQMGIQDGERENKAKEERNFRVIIQIDLLPEKKKHKITEGTQITNMNVALNCMVGKIR